MRAHREREVAVRVDVDEPRDDDAARGVQADPRGSHVRADRDHAPVGDPHVRALGAAVRTRQRSASLDGDVEHLTSW